MLVPSDIKSSIYFIIHIGLEYLTKLWVTHFTHEIQPKGLKIKIKPTGYDLQHVKGFYTKKHTL